LNSVFFIANSYEQRLLGTLSMVYVTITSATIPGYRGRYLGTTELQTANYV